MNVGTCVSGDCCAVGAESSVVVHDKKHYGIYAGAVQRYESRMLYAVLYTELRDCERVGCMRDRN